MKTVISNWCTSIIKEYRTKQIKTHKDCLILIFAILVPHLISRYKNESIEYLVKEAIQNNKSLIDENESLCSEINKFKDIIKEK